MKAKISIIVAMDEKRGIGKNGKIPWHIPEDLKHFRQITTGHPVIMGRKTFESIGRPLSNRTNIVVTHSASLARRGLLKLTNFIVAHSLGRAIEEAKRSPGSEEIFVIGGGQIYTQAIDRADKLYLTIVEGTYDADTFFPDHAEFKKVVFNEKREQDGYEFTFLELER